MLQLKVHKYGDEDRSARYLPHRLSSHHHQESRVGVDALKRAHSAYHFGTGKYERVFLQLLCSVFVFRCSPHPPRLFQLPTAEAAIQFYSAVSVQVSVCSCMFVCFKCGFSTNWKYFPAQYDSLFRGCFFFLGGLFVVARSNGFFLVLELSVGTF